MSQVPLCHKLLQELDDIDQSHKRARLSLYLQDIHFLTSSDKADSNTSGTFSTSISSASSPSTLFSGSDDLGSYISLTSSEIIDDYLATVEKEIHRLQEEISTAQVLRHKRKVPKTSQICLLKTWRDGNVDQFRRKVRTASPEAIGHWAGVSPGTVVNSTNHVMVALLALHDKLI
jgi:hypothetical protein